MTVFVAKASGAAVNRLISPEVVGTLSEVDYKAINSFLNRSSVIWVGMEDETICCFWGVMLPTLISDRAYLWLHTTPALAEHKFVFIRHSQLAIREMLLDYPLIVGHCVAGETKSIRWLRWLGAKFLHPEGKLVPFEIRAA
jgi:hypothetical protein